MKAEQAASKCQSSWFEKEIIRLEIKVNAKASNTNKQIYYKEGKLTSYNPTQCPIQPRLCATNEAVHHCQRPHQDLQEHFGTADHTKP